MQTQPTAVYLLLILLAPSAAAQSRWQRLNPLPTPQTLRGATYAKNLFVAVGDWNTILTSPDAVTWTSRTAEKNAMLTDVAFGKGQFVGIGASDEEGGSVLRTSPDGIAWTEQARLSGYQLTRLVFANNLFVGLGTTEATIVEQTRPAILTSSDGRNWIERWRGPEGEGTPFSLAALVADRSLMIAVPAGVPRSLAVSTNGLYWNEVQLPADFPEKLGVAAGGGRFVLVNIERGGDHADSDTWSSSDGVNWERHSVKAGWDRVFAMGYGRGEFLLLAWRYVDSHFEYVALRSPDGRAWSENRLTGFDFAPAYDDDQENNVSRLLDAAGELILVGYRPYNPLLPRIFTSRDGASWTSQIPVDSAGYSLASDGNGFLAVSSWTNGREGGTSVRRSNNGTDWSEVQSLTNVFLRQITYGHGIYAGAGESGIFTSPDGRTWTRQTSPGAEWERLRFSNGIFLASGREVVAGRPCCPLPLLGVSTNARDWKVERVSDSFDYIDNAATDGTNLVVSAYRLRDTVRVLLASNGNGAWTEVYRPPSRHAFYPLLAHGNARFVVFNQAINSALTSGDGTNWTEHFVQTESYFTDLIFAGDQFFAAAQRLNAGLSSQEFQVLSSPDGVNWTPHPSGFFNLNATLTSTPQTLIAFSAYSQTILQSPWDIRLQDVQRLVDGRAGFRVLRGGGSAESLEIQAASRLSPADWKTIPVTWDLSNSHYAYEAQPGAVSERFYRAVAR